MILSLLPSNDLLARFLQEFTVEKQHVTGSQKHVETCALVRILCKIRCILKCSEIWLECCKRPEPDTASPIDGGVSMMINSTKRLAWSGCLCS